MNLFVAKSKVPKYFLEAKQSYPYAKSHLFKAPDNYPYAIIQNLDPVQPPSTTLRKVRVTHHHVLKLRRQ